MRDGGPVSRGSRVSGGGRPVTMLLVLLGACALVPFSFGHTQASARALAIQPDGKLVLAGTAGIGNRIAFALARYLPDGSLDPTFGTGGKVTTHFRGSPSVASSGSFAGAFARALAVQPDGKLVAAGAEDIGDRPAFALGRYLPNGSMDPAFGVGGKVTTDFGVGTP